MISNPDNHRSGGSSESRDFSKEARFNVYDNNNQLVLIRKSELDNLKLRFRELSELASVVLDTEPENIEKEQVVEFIEENTSN